MCCLQLSSSKKKNKKNSQAAAADKQGKQKPFLSASSKSEALWKFWKLYMYIKPKLNVMLQKVCSSLKLVIMSFRFNAVLQLQSS